MLKKAVNLSLSLFGIICLVVPMITLADDWNWNNSGWRDSHIIGVQKLNVGLGGSLYSPQIETQRIQFCPVNIGTLAEIKTFIALPFEIIQQIRKTTSRDEFRTIFLEELIEKGMTDIGIQEYFLNTVRSSSASSKEELKKTLFLLSFFENLPTSITNVIALKLDEAETDEEIEYLLDVLRYQELSDLGNAKVTEALERIRDSVSETLKDEIFDLSRDEENAFQESYKCDFEYGDFPRATISDYSFKVNQQVGENYLGYFDIETARNTFARMAGYNYLKVKGVELKDRYSEESFMCTFFSYVVAASYSQGDILMPLNRPIKRDNERSAEQLAMTLRNNIATIITQQLDVIRAEVGRHNGEICWPDIAKLVFNSIEAERTFKETVRVIYSSFSFSKGTPRLDAKTVTSTSFDWSNRAFLGSFGIPVENYYLSTE